MFSDEFAKQFATELEKFGQIADSAQWVEGEPLTAGLCKLASEDIKCGDFVVFSGDSCRKATEQDMNSIPLSPDEIGVALHRAKKGETVQVFVDGLTQDRAVVFESEASKVLLINKQDALMIINDFGMKVEDFEHYYNAHKFIQFEIHTKATAYLDLVGGQLFLWSGLGEHYDYGAEFAVKTPERLAEILKVLAV